MKKSKIFIIMSLCLVIALFVSIFAIYNRIFPKAPPIELPDLNQDMTITVSYPDGTQEEWFREGSFTGRSFVDILARAKPTRIMSVNDHPDVAEFHTVSYVCKNKTYTYYIYDSNGKTYVEIPYVGVYELY